MPNFEIVYVNGTNEIISGEDQVDALENSEIDVNDENVAKDIVSIRELGAGEQVEMYKLDYPKEVHKNETPKE